MARVTFDSVFTRHDDNTLEPKQAIRVGGITLGPGVRFGRGTAFAGIDFTNFIGKELEIKTEGNTLVITGIY